MSKGNHQKFEIEGKNPLRGTVKVSGSKNAALPILCGALLSKEPSTLHNIPDIADTHTILNIFECLNVKTKFENGTATVDASELKLSEIPHEHVCSLRASILLLGPLLARLGIAKLPFPGGCVLGKRPVFAHTHALKSLGGKSH